MKTIVTPCDFSGMRTPVSQFPCSQLCITHDPRKIAENFKILHYVCQYCSKDNSKDNNIHSSSPQDKPKFQPNEEGKSTTEINSLEKKHTEIVHKKQMSSSSICNIYSMMFRSSP
jgi:hypothetical protein